MFCGFSTPAHLCALNRELPLWRCVNTDAGTLCAVLSPLRRCVSPDAGTLCAVLSPLWRCVSTNVGTVGADLPTPYPLCLMEWLEAWSDWTPLPVTFLCPQLRLPALCPGRVLCSETLINIWVEPAIESVFFPDRTVRPEMDSAGADPVRTAVTQQGILLGQHSTQLTAASREVDLLTAQVAELNVRVQELQQEALASRSAASLVRSPPQAEPEPHANSPPPYDGDPSSCRAFLSHAPWSLHSSLAVTSRRSLRWHSWSPSWMGGPVIGQLLCGMLVPHSVPHFRISEQRWLSCLTDLLRVTRQPPSWRGWIRMVAQSRTIPSSLEHWRPPATGMKLLCALDFGRGWMMRSRTRLLLTSCLVILTPLWNWLCVWRGVFSVAVSGGLLDPPDIGGGLPGSQFCPCLLTLCSWPGAHAGGTSTPHSQGEAGSTGSRSLSVLREAWTQSHPVSFKSRGPSVSRGILMGASPCFESPKSRTLLPVSVKYKDTIHSCSALVDSGAEGNFLDISVAAQWGIPAIPLPSPISVRSLNGLLLSSITHSTPSVSLVVSGNHREVIELYLLDSPGAPVVLGHPWLVQHNPHVDWSGNSVLSWSQSCLASCLGAALSSGCLSSVFQVESADLSGVPAEYHDLCRVFSKSRATSLPPHRPYDCAIDLLPGTSPPKGRLYSLSGPEREAMDKYIKESLNAASSVPLPHLLALGSSS